MVQAIIFVSLNAMYAFGWLLGYVYGKNAGRQEAREHELPRGQA